MFDFTAHGLVESPRKLPLPGGGPQTIGAVLDRQVAIEPAKLALVGRSARLSYGELDERVARAAAAFHCLGVRQYDRIAACLPNDVDIIVAFIACARIGAIWVGVNRPLAPPEKKYLLQDCGARVYLTDPQGVAEIEALTTELPDLQHVVCADRDATSCQWREMLDVARAGDAPAIAVDSFAPAAIAYTSGTTGRPKGAVHSHHNILLPGAIHALERDYGEDCTQGVMLPMTILNLMVLAPMTAFQYGSACVCMDSVKPVDVARWVREEKIGHFASVPTVVQDLLTSPDVSASDLQTLGQPDIGGAGTARSFQDLYRERFGQRMTIAYGMTEAPTIVAKTSPDEEPEEGLCGRAVAQVEILVVDRDDQPLPQGETGEICVRPASDGPYANVYTTMLGYWKHADATREALSNGMYHSGDLGCLDERGRLYIRGRMKELIIRGGANVYPAEVETVLAAHPGVTDAAVLGIDDERLGQRVVAVLEVAELPSDDAAQGLAQELAAYAGQQLARYKVPQQFKFVTSLPRNAMNKVIKPQLGALFTKGD